MEPIQGIVVVFALFFLSRVFLRFKDGNITPGELIFWSGICVAVIVIAIVPWITNAFSTVFGVDRPIDFFIYVSIVVLFYLIFRIYVKLENMEHNITKIVREIAKRKK